MDNETWSEKPNAFADAVEDAKNHFGLPLPGEMDRKETNSKRDPDSLRAKDTETTENHPGE